MSPRCGGTSKRQHRSVLLCSQVQAVGMEKGRWREKRRRKMPRTNEQWKDYSNTLRDKCLQHQSVVCIGLSYWLDEPLGYCQATRWWQWRKKPRCLANGVPSPCPALIPKHGPAAPARPWRPSCSAVPPGAWISLPRARSSSGPAAPATPHRGGDPWNTALPPPAPTSPPSAEPPGRRERELHPSARPPGAGLPPGGAGQCGGRPGWLRRRAEGWAGRRWHREVINDAALPEAGRGEGWLSRRSVGAVVGSSAELPQSSRRAPLPGSPAPAATAPPPPPGSACWRYVALPVCSGFPGGPRLLGGRQPRPERFRGADGGDGRHEAAHQAGHRGG